MTAVKGLVLSGMAAEASLVFPKRRFSLRLAPRNTQWGKWCGAKPDSQPLAVVNVAGTECLLDGVFKTFLWCPSVTVASGEFTIQGYLGQAMVPHSGDMPSPSRLWLQQHGQYASNFCPIRDLSIGEVVIPINVEDGAETGLMEAIKKCLWRH